MSNCRDLRDDTSYYVLGKLKCYYINGEEENYSKFVVFLLQRRRRVIQFIRYVYENLDSFKKQTKLSLVNAFQTFQEEAYKTYNLEHNLRDGRSKLFDKDWNSK